MKFDIKTSDGAVQAFGKIYKNDYPFGIEQSTTSLTYVTKTETGLAIESGDVITVYGHGNGVNTVSIENFRMYCENPSVLVEVS